MSSFAMTKSLKRIAEIARQDGRYKIDAYLFVQQSLAFAQLQRGRIPRRSSGSDAERESGPAGELDSSGESPIDAESVSPLEPHLTGQELCESIRMYAQELFGLMAKVVLNSWGIKDTGDFGEIVYKLIEIGEMTKSETDQREDFDRIYDFKHAFERDYRISIPDET